MLNEREVISGYVKKIKHQLRFANIKKITKNIDDILIHTYYAWLGDSIGPYCGGDDPYRYLLNTSNNTIQGLLRFPKEKPEAWRLPSGTPFVYSQYIFELLKRVDDVKIWHKLLVDLSICSINDTLSQIS